jgi:GTP-binding protein EngB required for normal cell division
MTGADSEKKLYALVQTACSRFQITSLNRQIEAVRDVLQETRLIDVAILGQFKAGKTSFINSLIGSCVLPVGVIPVTTVITRITRVQYGERERAVVTLLDGSTRDIPLALLEEYIAEAKNPANHKNVAVVDIELPLFEHYHGLRLVDTPGMGSAFKYNTATSEAWLPRVGAAIVAISADRPLSENDLALLRELVRYTPEIVLLLTKADLLTAEQQQEVVSFFKQTIERECKRIFPIFLFSVRTETEQYRQRLDSELFMPLSQNATSELQKISHHKLHSLCQSCIDLLEVALKASQQADHERDSIKRLILDEKTDYTLISAELSRIAREQMKRTRDLITAHLHAKHRVALTRKIMANLRQAIHSWKGNLWGFTRQYECWIAETMATELQKISQAEHLHFFETLHRARAGIARSVSLFKNLLDRNIEKVLGIQLSEAHWNTEVPEPAHPDVAFARSFDFHLDMLWFIIPMFIFRKAFERHFLHQIPWAVEVNLSRLAHQWEVGVNRAIEEMKSQALAYVRDELETVEWLLSQSQGGTEDIRQTIQMLTDQLSTL